MSLRIKHLNADSSFLLIFSSPAFDYDPQGQRPGSFTVLIDPWLSGSSTVFHRRFANTTLTVPSAVESLNDLPAPDLILISQDKPDHCHRDTLLSLSPDTPAHILGTSAAARRIRSWKHFDPKHIHSMRRFDERFPEQSVTRIPIPAFSESGQPGEVTISLMHAKMDLMGLHNAIAITYRPPTTALSARTASHVNLPPSPPLTPPDTDCSSLSTCTTSKLDAYPAISLPISPSTSPSSGPTAIYPLGLSNREPALSVLYSPHGLPYRYIEPFAKTHLLEQGALPLTALIHSMDRSSNPWYLGGNITMGAPNGIEIQREIGAKVWVGAHDEQKDNEGWSVKRLRTETLTVKELEDLMDMSIDEYGPRKGRNKRAKVKMLESGQELFIEGKY